MTGVSPRTVKLSGYPTALAVSNDGTNILVALPEGELCLFDREAKKPLRQFKFYGYNFERIAISPDNRFWVGVDSKHRLLMVPFQRGQKQGTFARDDLTISSDINFLDANRFYFSGWQ